MRNPFRYFNSSPEVIRLTVMMYIRYPLSLRQVEDLLFERGIDICHETVRFLVEPVRSDVRRGDQEAARSSFDRIPNGDGTSTRSSSEDQRGRHTIFGAPWITKAGIVRVNRLEAGRGGP